MTHDEKLLHILDYATNFAAGKDEIRRYLQDVMIKNVGDDCHVVACDGHQLIKVVMEKYTHDIGFDRLTAESVKNAAKVNEKSLLRESSVTADYPDYDRLMPNYDGCESLPGINVAFLSNAFTKLQALIRKVNKEKMGRVCFEKLSYDNGCLFTHKLDEFTFINIVIMPMRK